MTFVVPQNSKAGSGGKSPITWDNPKELEGYIQKLQNAAQRLATENRKLRKWHTTFCEKVCFIYKVGWAMTSIILKGNRDIILSTFYLEV